MSGILKNVICEPLLFGTKGEKVKPRIPSIPKAMACCCRCCSYCRWHNIPLSFLSSPSLPASTLFLLSSLFSEDAMYSICPSLQSILFIQCGRNCILFTLCHSERNKGNHPGPCFEPTYQPSKKNLIKESLSFAFFFLLVSQPTNLPSLATFLPSLSFTLSSHLPPSSTTFNPLPSFNYSKHEDHHRCRHRSFGPLRHRGRQGQPSPRPRHHQVG